jgi:aquaporin Z
MIAQTLVELIGTFVFLSVILATKGDALAVGVALAAMVFFGGAVSGAHFNPAVTFMQALGGKVDLLTAVVYVVVQLLGAAAAFGFSKFVLPQ